MSPESDRALSRRRFVQFLTASPLLAPGAAPVLRSLLPDSVDESRVDRIFGSILQDPTLISAPDQALNVLDFEPVAKKALPPAHWAYLATGVDDDSGIQANRDGFKAFSLRPRRLRDVSTVDTSTTVLGTKWETPIFISPTSSLKAFHPEGELAVARAARAKNHLQILSTVSTSSVEEVTAARGAPVWFQLYPTDDWSVGQALVRRAERAGCPTLVLTVDLKDGSNRETQFRGARLDDRNCVACHQPGFPAYASRKPMFDGVDLRHVTGLHPPTLSWEMVRRLRDLTRMTLVLKGIVTAEDARLAVRHGVDGIIVSNHGGRAENSNRSTIEALPEVLRGVAGKIPVMIDSGFRRGTDFFTALALGGAAVGVGRPCLWGLAAFGQPGVEMVLELLRRELRTIMRQCGTRSIREIGPGFVQRRLV